MSNITKSDVIPYFKDLKLELLTLKVDCLESIEGSPEFREGYSLALTDSLSLVNKIVNKINNEANKQKENGVL